MKKLTLVTALLFSVGSAQADVPQEVTDSLAAIQGDMTAVGTLMVLAAAAAIGLKWIKGAIFS